ncbi:quinone oxidoreductase isoform X1 [Cryptotermes secundus]|uniref:quinone oxidoreductase isoform X1 n=1 Tax=Cryptotermes secundus TaxID=105785 RepID=UPI000CD7D7D8|nr:quinone oxidoreductase isoform X1 [Cryptotermes secundus]
MKRECYVLFITAFSTLSKLHKAMRAVRIHKFGGPDNLKLEDIPVPSFRDSEVLVRVNAAGINPVDTYIREGAYATLPKLPAILGREVAGIVEDVGDGVSNLKKGDRVFALLPENGGYAEFVACKEENVYPLSEKLSFSQGSGLCIPYFTAYRALVTKCRIKPGEILLVHGASGAVGIAAVQIAKAYGLTVAGTAGTIEGMDVVKKVGADHVFNHREKGYLNNAVAAIGGHGFNVVLENLANVNLGADLTVLNQQARVAVVGCRGIVEVNPRSLMLTEGSIIGVMLAGATAEETQETAEVILRGIESGWVNPVISREYKLDEATEAHHDIIRTTGARGKLVFKL